MPEVLASTRRYAPAAFFIGGFVWDAVTLGRTIRPVDLFVVLGYLTGAAAILVAIGRDVTFRGSHYLGDILQFFFGGVFSALFIFYFLSSSSLAGYVVVLLLAAVLVGNEFVGSRYSELTVSWAFFMLSAIMFFNFALAHLFRSISTFWFYVGTLVAVALVLALRTATTRGTGSIVPAIVVAAAMLFFHAINIIPPVPLVKKQMLIAHELEKRGNSYVARVESPEWRVWRTSARTFHRTGDERVYCFTSVFVPRGIRTTIRHRWQLFDESRDEWTTTGTPSFPITGGREGGFRGYTYKQNVVPGRWRVIAESESGAAIGIITFEIRPGTPQRLKSVAL